MDILEFPSPHDLPIVMISERINKITSVRLPDMQAELLEIREDEAALKLGLGEPEAFDCIPHAFV